MRHAILCAMLVVPAATPPAAMAQDRGAGEVARSPAGRVGQRLQHDVLSSDGAVPISRIANRIESRVQSRIGNRIDRFYDPQADPVTALRQANERARTVRQPTRR